MRYYRLFTFIIVLLFAFTAKADVFTVTSNADSGPGTLREALTLADANGGGVKDIINFNIADLSDEGRTIMLLSQLPDLSTNLVVDGSTQPGNKIGISDAKIIIKTGQGGPFTVFRGASVFYVSIYGFYFLDTGGPCVATPDGAAKKALDIQQSSHIYFGAKGKGNVVNGYQAEAVTFRNVSHIFLYDNIFGQYAYSPDYVCTGTINFYNASVIEVGAADAGNTFFTALRIEMVNIPGIDTLNIKGNNFAVANDGETVIHFIYDTYLYITRHIDNPSDPVPNVLMNISENLFSHFDQFSGMNISELNGPIFIKHNWFGTDRTATIPLNLKRAHPGDGGGIRLTNVGGDVVIGDDAPALGNKFAYSVVGFVAENTPNVKVIRNSFKCISSKEFVEYGGPPLPKIAVTANTGQFIVGTTEANAVVDIYLSDDCTNCSPETYLGTTNADVAGNWKYTFAQPYERSVLANAHVGNRSSAFTKPEINISKLQVTNFDCGHSGSISGLTVSNTDKLKWVDESGAVVSTELELKDFKAGRYKLIIGEYCTVESEYLTIYDARPKIDDSELKKTNPTCSQSNGSIVNLYGATEDLQPLTYEWRNQKNELVGTTLHIFDLPPGSYTLTVKTPAGCEAQYGPVVLTNSTGPNIDDINHVITPSACSQATGAVTGIAVTGTGTLKYSWKNAQNVEVSTVADLVNQPPGDYILTVSDGSPCGTLSTQPFTIPVLNDINIDVSTKALQPATCDNFDGSIKNLTISGVNLIYSWKNDQNQEVGTDKDLIGVPAGTYTLTVTGQSYCNPVFSEPITIPSINGVSLDLSTQGGRSATCNESNGSITGLKAPGATTYQWTITGTGAIKSTQLDLKDVPAGFYTLTISNATCSKSYDFEVAGFPPTVFTGITYTSTKSCQAFNTGTLTANTDNANVQPLKYRWVNSAGENAGFDKFVPFLPPGTYKLYLTDNNYCENLYRDDYVVYQYPEFKVLNFGTVTNTQCGVGIGAVSATMVTGGTGNYAYQWLDADNNDSPIPGKNQPVLTNVLKGHYKLRITDGGCSLAEIPYTIIDEAVTPPSPSADNIQVYNTGPAVIKVNSPFPTAIYRLYETATSPQPIKDTIGGNIKINVTESRSYYVSLTYGYCESARTEVKVFLSALKGNIPNTFTPNGDGINDYWNIPGLDTYPNAKVNVFNRYGAPVFQSIGYARPFDGTSNGKPLPAGVYYYIITLKKGDVLSGNVTIIR
jgi:gliding motility-associated-like protein